MPQNERRLWNSTLTRKTPLRAKSGNQRQRTPLNKIGKKGRANQKANKEIDKEAARHGITFCEAQLDGCLGSFMLQRMHSKKRRNIRGAEIIEAIYGCDHCHSIAELWPEAKMTEFVRAKIALRVV